MSTISLVTLGVLVLVDEVLGFNVLSPLLQHSQMQYPGHWWH